MRSARVHASLAAVPEGRRLIERYGADANTIYLRLVIAADCPKVIANKFTDFCGVIYPDLRPTPLEPRKPA
jgi:hypothetical protein